VDSFESCHENSLCCGVLIVCCNFRHCLVKLNS